MASQDKQNVTKVYRFKYSDDILPYMVQFANVHKHDDRATYKEAWQTWCIDNDELIQREYNRQTSIGYEDDFDTLVTKMYNSVRYYYGKRSNKKTEPKERRKYVRVSKDVISILDTYIKEHAGDDDFKPSTAFSVCIEANYYDRALTTEMERMRTECEMSETEITAKLKKTFNNRYYLFSKK